MPWLPPASRHSIHPVIFQTPEAQAAYVRQWVQDRCGFSPTNMKLDFYPGRYATDKYSIIPVATWSCTSPRRSARRRHPEEPEHLNWYTLGGRWSDTFEHVGGGPHELPGVRAPGTARRGEGGGDALRQLVGVAHALPQDHQALGRRGRTSRSQTMNVHGSRPCSWRWGAGKPPRPRRRAAEADPDAAAAQAVGRTTVGRALASRPRPATPLGGAERSNRTAAVRSVQSPREGTTALLGKVVCAGFHELLQCVEDAGRRVPRFVPA